MLALLWLLRGFQHWNPIKPCLQHARRSFLLKFADKQEKYSFLPQSGFSLAMDLVILSAFVHPQRGMEENESVGALSCATLTPACPFGGNGLGRRGPC